MNKINNSRGNLKFGFTLIELLVVVAIISLLASVVLASLSKARQKASKAAATSELKSFITQAIILRGEKTGFTPPIASNCTGGTLANPTISSLVADITKNSNGAPTCSTNNAFTPTTISIHATMKDSSIVCVDTTGRTGTSAGTAGLCP